MSSLHLFSGANCGRWSMGAIPLTDTLSVSCFLFKYLMTSATLVSSIKFLQVGRKLYIQYICIIFDSQYLVLLADHCRQFLTSLKPDCCSAHFLIISLFYQKSLKLSFLYSSIDTFLPYQELSIPPNFFFTYRTKLHKDNYVFFVTYIFPFRFYNLHVLHCRTRYFISIPRICLLYLLLLFRTMIDQSLECTGTSKIKIPKLKDTTWACRALPA